MKCGSIRPPAKSLVRGKNVFAGYLNLPEKTAEALDAEWLAAHR